MENITDYKITCKKCGYSWIPRKATPKKCPACQTWLIEFEKRAGVTV